MTARLIDGKAIAAKVRAEAASAGAALEQATGVKPGLAVILVGDDPASQIYVRHKEKDCAESGFASWVHRMPADTTEADLLAKIDAVNADPAVHGLIVQLPLPKHLDERRILDRVDPDKDVDGLHPMNAGRLLTGRPGPRACTPAGILRMLDEIGFDPEGKRALVIGRSNIVGKPMALMLLERHATVTLAHSRTADLEEEALRADLIVAAVGVRHLVKGSWVKPGAVVIDVGMNRVEGKLTGDVDFDAASERAGWITPVPGGVGPMTRAMLLMNTLAAAERRARED